ncbi:transposase family protein [Desulfococcaceae bacterium HSG7]|nr:transposase family protein [Desulfococcaceae bacterium HSG7]
MLIAEKLSRRPVTFRRLTGVDVALFLKICKKIRPLWEKRRHNSENGGRPHSLCGLENHLLAMPLYYRCYVTYEFPSCLFDCHETTVMRSVRRIEKSAAQVIHIKKNRVIPVRMSSGLYQMRPNSPHSVRKKDSVNITVAEREDTRSKRNTLSGLTAVFMQFHVHTPEVSVTLPYIKTGKTETDFSESRKKATAVIRE